MKNKIAITIIGLTIVLSIVACSNKDSLTETTETNSIVEDSETIDIEVVTTESIDTTEVAESDEVTEILATYREQGYALITAQDIENIIAGGYDPTNPTYIEALEIEEYGNTLDFDGINGIEKFNKWAQSQGADFADGWTFIYKNGSGAGDQPSYGVYMNEGSPLYGTVYHVGDYLPNGDQLVGTMDEYGDWLAEDTVEKLEERGVEIEEREDAIVIHIGD